MGFAEEIGKMAAHQQLRVSRITTPTKICGGRKCLLINPRLCPVILGIALNIFLPCSLQSLGSTISDFKQIVVGLGGETLASQVVLSSSSTDTKLITKGPTKNTDGKRCYWYLCMDCPRPADLNCTLCLVWMSLILRILTNRLDQNH